MLIRFLAMLIRFLALEVVFWLWRTIFGDVDSIFGDVDFFWQKWGVFEGFWLFFGFLVKSKLEKRKSLSAFF